MGKRQTKRKYDQIGDTTKNNKDGSLTKRQRKSRARRDRKKRFPLLELPNRALVCIIQHLLNAPTTEFLDRRSIAQMSGDIYAFCSAHSKLFGIFRSFMKSIYVKFGQYLKAEGRPWLERSDALARLARASIFHLYLESIEASEATRFLAALAKSEVAVESLSLGFSLRRVPNPSQQDLAASLIDLALASKNKLQVFHLSLRNLSQGVLDAERLAPALQNLQALSISSTPGAREYLNVEVLVSALGEKLRYFALRNVRGLRSKETCSQILTGISRSCPKIIHIELVGMHPRVVPAMTAFAISYQSRLRYYDMTRSHDLAGTSCIETSGDVLESYAHELYKVMSVCSNIRHVSIDQNILKNWRTALEALALRADTLRGIKIDVSNLTPADMDQIFEATPNLRELRLFGSCQDATFINICSKVGPNLHALHMSKKLAWNASDDTIQAIGMCRELRELSVAHGKKMNLRIVSYNAVEEMFKGIGGNLRMLSWCFQLSWKNPAWPQDMKVHKQRPCTDLARLLWTYCRKLELVEIEYMGTGADAKLFHSCFADLRKHFHSILLYLHRSRPVWFGKKWTGEEECYT